MDDKPKPRKPRPAGASRRGPAKGRPNPGSSRLVTTYWSDAEYAQLLEDAERAGMPVAAYLHSVLLPVDDTAVQARLTGLLAEFHKVSGYIDEIVQHMDGGTIPQMPEARAAQKEGRMAMQELLRVLEGGSH
jgi:hypothetical protein